MCIKVTASTYLRHKQSQFNIDINLPQIGSQRDSLTLKYCELPDFSNACVFTFKIIIKTGKYLHIFNSGWLRSVVFKLWYTYTCVTCRVIQLS